jgi:two-component system, chemotaxis family, chemotaxis protein CheY
VPLRVLIVDDNEASRVLLGCMIAELGHTTQAEAHDMAQALAAYQAQKPDVVTLDLSMPEADGLTVLKALRALDPAAKVLIVSGNSQQRIIDALLEAGAGGYLTKPVTADELGQAFTKLTA